MGIKKVIGKRINTKRLELGISQEELAYKCGVSANTVSAIENGKVYAKLNNIHKICKQLNIKMIELFNGY